MIGMTEKKLFTVIQLRKATSQFFQHLEYSFMCLSCSESEKTRE